MASPHFYALLPHDLRSGMELIEVAGHQRWIRSRLQELFDTAESVFGQNKLLLSGRHVRYLGASAVKCTGRADVLPERDEK
jgi:hypothetical protein